MKEDFILKAERLLRTGRVKLIKDSCNFEAQIFYFKILNPIEDFIVVKDDKGWRCGYIEPLEHFNKRNMRPLKEGCKKRARWSCTLNIGKIKCCHIIACMGIINDVHIRELVKSNVSFKEAVKLGRSTALYQSENEGVEEKECLDRFHHSGDSAPSHIQKTGGLKQ